MHGVANASRVYSPLMLNEEWPKIGRLMFTLVCAIIGVTMNGFFVASFFVEHSLKRVGLVYMACVGLSDLIISATTMPMSAVVLLSGQWNTDYVCYTLQFLVEGSTYSYCVFFALVALETYYRLVRDQRDYAAFISIRVGFLSLVIFIICFGLAAVGVFLDLDYDYCNRRQLGSLFFKLPTGVIFNVIPFVTIFFGLFSASCRMRAKAKKHGHYRRSQHYEQDATRNNLNIAAYILFVSSWLPYVIVVHFFPDSPDSRYYHTAWVGIGRSVITSFLYGCIDNSFRNAFAYLFNYCCCKSTLSGSLASRHRRALEYKCTSGDVRVHIMHQAVNLSSPQRGGSSTRETQDQSLI